MKDKIEIGEYMRTNNGDIAKIVEIRKKERDCDTYYITDVTTASGFFEHIKAHSKNILDLIETGDIVRVYMEDDVEADGVYEDTNMFEVVGVTTDGLEVVLLGKGFILEFFPKENIRGIVTHEQFKEMEYRV